MAKIFLVPFNYPTKDIGIGPSFRYIGMFGTGNRCGSILAEVFSQPPLRPEEISIQDREDKDIGANSSSEADDFIVSVLVFSPQKIEDLLQAAENGTAAPDEFFPPIEWTVLVALIPTDYMEMMKDLYTLLAEELVKEGQSELIVEEENKPRILFEFTIQDNDIRFLPPLSKQISLVGGTQQRPAN